MIFHPETDQRALIDEAFSRPLDELLPLSRLHQSDPREPWEPIAGLGTFGVAVEEALGGIGLGPVEEALVAMELGQRLASPQILATLMAVHVAPESARQAIAAGEWRVAMARVTGQQVCVIDGDGARALLLRRDDAATLVEPQTLPAREVIDTHHWTARLETAALAGPETTWCEGVALLRIRLIEAAALCGVAACASGMAVAYASLREQFGHPIGAFQAVKHHCANMAMATMAARDQTGFAAVALAQGRADAALQTEAALLLAMEAALANARCNVQVHGGIGFSEEADPHLAVKRAHLLVEMAGGVEAATARVAAAEAPLLGGRIDG